MSKTKINKLIKYHKYKVSHFNFIMGNATRKTKDAVYALFVLMLLFSGVCGIYFGLVHSNEILIFLPVFLVLLIMYTTINLLTKFRAKSLNLEVKKLEKNRYSILRKYLIKNMLIDSLDFLIDQLEKQKKGFSIARIGAGLILAIGVYFSDTICLGFECYSNAFIELTSQERHFYLLFITNFFVISTAVIFYMVDSLRVLLFSNDQNQLNLLKEMLVEIRLDRK